MALHQHEPPGFELRSGGYFNSQKFLAFRCAQRMPRPRECDVRNVLSPLARNPLPLALRFDLFFKQSRALDIPGESGSDDPHRSARRKQDDFRASQSQQWHFDFFKRAAQRIDTIIRDFPDEFQRQMKIFMSSPRYAVARDQTN